MFTPDLVTILGGSVGIGAKLAGCCGDMQREKFEKIVKYSVTDLRSTS